MIEDDYVKPVILSMLQRRGENYRVGNENIFWMYISRHARVDRLIVKLNVTLKNRDEFVEFSDDGFELSLFDELFETQHIQKCDGAVREGDHDTPPEKESSVT